MKRPSNMLDPRVRSQWWLQGGIAAVAASVVAFVAAFLISLSLWLPTLLTLGAVFLAAVVPPLRYRRWRYEIRTRDVFISKGSIFHEARLIPFDRIQFVESEQGPFDRLFQLAHVSVFTAAGNAGSIPGLAVTEAEALREELSRIAGTLTV